MRAEEIRRAKALFHFADAVRTYEKFQTALSLTAEHAKVDFLVETGEQIFHDCTVGYFQDLGLTPQGLEALLGAIVSGKISEIC